MTRLSLTCCGLLLCAGIAEAGIENAGTTAGNFLSIGSGAAVLSMGGAAIGSGRDLNAAAWNPAALAWVSGNEFAISHASLADQTSQEWASFGGRMGRTGTRWSVHGLFQSEGSFEGRDASNLPTSAFDASSMAIGLQLAQGVAGRFAFGLGAQYLSENLGSATGSGLGFDAGAQAFAGDVGFGLAARNVGGKMRYDSGSYDLPGNLGFGVSWAPRATGLRLALDANFPKAYYNDVRMGAEWRWQDRVALRAGYRKELSAPAGEPIGGPSFGIGTGVSGWWIDYGFLTGGVSGQSQHRIGLTFRPSLANLGSGLLGSNDEKPREKAPVAVAPKPAKKQDVPAVAAKPAKSKKDETPVATRPAEKRDAPAVVTPAPAPFAPTPVAVAPLKITTPPSSSTVASRPVRMTTSTLAASKPVSQPKLQVAEPEAPAPAPATSPVLDTAPPAKADPAPAAQKAAEPRPSTITVRGKETLETIAQRWGTSVAAIMMENNLVSTKVKPGRTLKLPPASR